MRERKITIVRILATENVQLQHIFPASHQDKIETFSQPNFADCPREFIKVCKERKNYQAKKNERDCGT